MIVIAGLDGLPSVLHSNGKHIVLKDDEHSHDVSSGPHSALLQALMDPFDRLWISLKGSHLLTKLSDQSEDLSVA